MSGTAPQPTVEALIVSYNTRALLAECLESLEVAPAYRPHPGRGWRLCDNASTDAAPTWSASRFPDVRLVRSAENVGFARANNLLVASKASPSTCCFLNRTR
jgi:GT2 family glycosyltransferase